MLLISYLPGLHVDIPPAQTGLIDSCDSIRWRHERLPFPSGDAAATSLSLGSNHHLYVSWHHPIALQHVDCGDALTAFSGELSWLTSTLEGPQVLLRPLLRRPSFLQRRLYPSPGRTHSRDLSRSHSLRMAPDRQPPSRVGTKAGRQRSRDYLGKPRETLFRALKCFYLLRNGGEALQANEGLILPRDTTLPLASGFRKHADVGAAATILSHPRIPNSRPR